MCSLRRKTVVKVNRRAAEQLPVLHTEGTVHEKKPLMNSSTLRLIVGKKERKSTNASTTAKASSRQGVGKFSGMGKFESRGEV